MIEKEQNVISDIHNWVVKESTCWKSNIFTIKFFDSYWTFLKVNLISQVFHWLFFVPITKINNL